MEDTTLSLRGVTLRCICACGGGTSLSLDRIMKSGELNQLILLLHNYCKIVHHPVFFFSFIILAILGVVLFKNCYSIFKVMYSFFFLCDFFSPSYLN